MSILDDINEVPAPAIEESAPAPAEEQAPKGMGIDLGFLQAKTGEGSIEDYIDHPMNVGRSKGLAQLIRGFTGLFGALDLAIIDIVVGLMQFTKEKKEVKTVVS